MLEMCRLAEREGIEVRWWDYHPTILGLYWHPLNLPPVIGINSVIEQNTPLLRTIMAEELGHHYTSSGQGLCRTFCHYRNRLEISKIEYKALRWAANYLMPKPKVAYALAQGYREKWELSDLFSVTDDFTTFRMGLPDITYQLGRR